MSFNTRESAVKAAVPEDAVRLLTRDGLIIFLHEQELHVVGLHYYTLTERWEASIDYQVPVDELVEMVT